MIPGINSTTAITNNNSYAKQQQQTYQQQQQQQQHQHQQQQFTTYKVQTNQYGAEKTRQVNWLFLDAKHHPYKQPFLSLTNEVTH